MAKPRHIIFVDWHGVLRGTAPGYHGRDLHGFQFGTSAAAHMLKRHQSYVHSRSKTNSRPRRGSAPLIKNYVETNPYGIDLKEAHLIMGYTTNFFQKRLNRRIFSDNILGRSERELINSLNSAFDKLPSLEGVFRRGLGTTPDWFDEKYAVKGKVFETHFASVSKHLSSNYRRDKVMEFRSRHVKDISALAMDVQFSKQIGRKAAASEYLIQANSKFIVLKVNRKRSKYILGDYD